MAFEREIAPVNAYVKDRTQVLISPNVLRILLINVSTCSVRNRASSSDRTERTGWPHVLLHFPQQNHCWRGNMKRHGFAISEVITSSAMFVSAHTQSASTTHLVHSGGVGEIYDGNMALSGTNYEERVDDVHSVNALRKLYCRDRCWTP
jgi:hypothetical protein